MNSLLNDLRYSLRLLRQRPGFTFVAIITLALGIGVNTALFSVFEAFALKPLPLKNPESIVRVSSRDRDGATRLLFSYADYLAYRDRNHVLADLAAWNKVAVTLGTRPAGAGDDLTALSGDDEYLFGQLVSGNYFAALDAEMALGRAFLPEEDRTPNARPVVVLSYGFWQRRFDSDPQIIGKTIPLDGQPFTVVGVAARNFIGTEPDAPQFWMPLMMRDTVIGEGGWNYKRWLTDRDAESFALVGRLRPGVSRQQAEAEMRVIAEQLPGDTADRQPKTGIRLSRAATFIEINAELMPLVVPLLLAVGLVLLIACANVANLMLARAAGRSREMAIRAALGASRWRTIRQLLMESLLVAVIGGFAGLLLAVWGIDLLVSISPRGTPRLDEISLDVSVFAFTLAASLLTGVLFGLAPAIFASRVDINETLKEGARAVSAGSARHRLRNGLVVAEIALALVVLVGAGLLVRSFVRLQAVEPGFNPDHLLTMWIGLSDPRYEVRGARRQFLKELTPKLWAIPGVEAVAVGNDLPIQGTDSSSIPTIEGHPSTREEQERLVGLHPVGAGYFEALGMRLLKGRGFTERDNESAAPVAVINETAARRLWPGEEPIGKHFTFDSPSAPDFRWTEVVGVIADVKHDGLNAESGMHAYLPNLQMPWPFHTIALRSQLDNAS
ncbi:MAG TPA: ABC transporter permease, partial [Blastocatellia bacterium]|nr:ABC transporter permease [Blastocatellia bacterium]